jgi:hypothetical protein
MALVTDKTKRIEAPDGSGWLDIKALGWLALDNARTKRLHQLADLAKALKDVTLPTAPKSSEPTDPLVGYDKRYLLAHGVAAWSYSDTVDVEQLDEPTADWAAHEILAYSVPGETEVGKNSSSSTDTEATQSGTPLLMNGR